MSWIALGAPAWPALEDGWSWWVLPITACLALGIALSQRYRWSVAVAASCLALGFTAAVAIDALGVPVGLGLLLGAIWAVSRVRRTGRRAPPPGV